LGMEKSSQLKKSIIFQRGRVETTNQKIMEDICKSDQTLWAWTSIFVLHNFHS
jgi:hypothetical protein